MKTIVLHILTTGLLFFCYIGNIHAAELTANVDTNNIALGDVITLTVTIDQQNPSPIDFSELNAQFDILRQNRSSKVNLINGTLNAKTQWNILITPKEEGTLIIPSFSSSGAFSDAIPVIVSSKNTSAEQSKAEQKHPEVFLESALDKQQAYVQEQIIYTVKLFYRVAITGYSEQPLALDNTVVEPIYENNYKTQVNAITYNVLEKKICAVSTN